MFKPVPMTRLRLVILKRDERAVLCHLGRAGAVQLTRTAAGPDTAPLAPSSRSEERARLERVSARLENLRHSLAPPAEDNHASSREISLAQAEEKIRWIETQAGERLKRRQQLEQRFAALTAATDQIADFSGLELPLDPQDGSNFLHFVAGSLPLENMAKLEAGGNAAVFPLAERDGRQRLLAMTTRPNRPNLEHALEQAGFEPEKLPVVAGATTSGLAERNQREQEQIAAELKDLNAILHTFVEEFPPVWVQSEMAMSLERRLLEADQNFPCTETSLFVAGWVPSADLGTLEQRIQEITHGCCVLEATPAEELETEEIPVLLRQPRFLRPFAMLVTAYGLPQYREVEPTLFVALSYLLMFGMMFGDVGHGLTFACGGLAILWRSRQPQMRDAGLLLLFCGLSSMVFGVLYGSCFGLPALKRFALWHDPLEGDPLGFMSIGIGIGIGLMSLGLVLNVINQVRRGHLLSGVLDKFGMAGLVFYWGALVLILKPAAIQSRGLGAGILFLLLPVLGWMLKEPVEVLRAHRARPAAAGGSLSACFMESLLEVFEGLMSYFSNTISFVRLAAYAMSHSALLLAAFMLAEQIKHVPAAGGLLSVLVIVLGNLVAIVLEGIVAAVQALRLEYYEFFSKFYSGNGQPFQPFSLAGAGQVRTA